MHPAFWPVALIFACAIPPILYATRRRAMRSASEHVVGPYVLLRQLGSGGMGHVFIAEHRKLRRRVALKLIHAEHMEDEALLTRFDREVQSLATLANPHVVRVHDYGRAADGSLYYAMELVQGHTLDQLVGAQGPLNCERVVRILRQLCDALDDAHWRGLVHRDLKPENVMLTERAGVRDFAVLLDFGLVGAMERGPTHAALTRADAIMGTPGFMAPEQCGGDARVTPATDIYSMGAIAYFLLTGSPPFKGGSLIEIVAAQFSEEPRPVAEIDSSIPMALSSVIARCLKSEARDRYPDARALDRALADSIASL